MTLSPLLNRIPVGWHQLWSQKGRLAVSLLGVAFANVLMFVQLGIMNTLFDSNTLFHRLTNADAVIISKDALQLTQLQTFNRSILLQALDVDGIASANPVYLEFTQLKKPNEDKTSRAMMIGFVPNESPIQSESVTNLMHKLKMPDTVLFDRKARGDFASVIEMIGESGSAPVVIGGKNVAAAGIFSLGAAFNVDIYLLASAQTLLRHAPKRSGNFPSLGLLKFSENVKSEKVIADLKRRLPDDVRVMSKKAFAEYEKDYIQKKSPISFIFSLGAALGFCVGTAIVYQILSSDVSAHLAQYATFKAIGFSDLYLLSVIFEQAFILAILGFIPGALISTGIYSFIFKFANLPIKMTADRLIFILVLTLIMCTVSGIIASRKLREVDPAELF